MKDKKTVSDLPDKIIKELSQYKTLNFSTLKFFLSTSSPTLSYHLKELLEKEIITFDKIGKEKKYRLTPKVLDTFDTKINIVSENYARWFDGAFDDPIRVDEFTKHVTTSVGSLFLYSVLKSLETGDNWTRVLDLDELIELTVREIVKPSVDNYGEKIKKMNDVLSKHDFDTFFSKMKNKYLPRVNEDLEYIDSWLEETYEDSIRFLKHESHEQIEI